MVEVFKTNVNEQAHAKFLLDRIHGTFIGYLANFDLEDCDRILRVQCVSGEVQASPLITLLNGYGVEVAVLPDEIPSPMNRKPLPDRCMHMMLACVPSRMAS